MTAADIVVALAAVAAVAGLGWFFFGPRRAATAQLSGGVRRVEVKVAGGYSPDVIRVRQGVPLEIVFDRQEIGDCTSRVVFPDLAVTAALPAFTRTTVRLHPSRTGAFGFACGMNMIHGTLVVEPADTPPAEATHERGPVAPAAQVGSGADAVGGGGGAGRRAPRRDRGPDPAGEHRGGAVRAGAVRGDGPRGVRGGLGTRAAAGPVVAAGPDQPGDVLRRLADPPHRRSDSSPPRCGHEQPHHLGHQRRVRLQPAGHPRPRAAARRRT